MAKPMIFTDDTQPTHFTFANQVGVQTDASASENPIPDEMGRTIEATCGSPTWKCQLALRQLCLPPLSCHSNHILQGQLP